MHLTEESWQRLDEDGNGAVNFFEFARWAGPRLGLSLGLELESACGVSACPCSGFRRREKKAKHKWEGGGLACDSKEHFFQMLKAAMRAIRKGRETGRWSPRCGQLVDLPVRPQADGPSYGTYGGDPVPTSLDRRPMHEGMGHVMQVALAK